MAICCHLTDNIYGQWTQYVLRLWRRGALALGVCVRSTWPGEWNLLHIF